MRFLTVMLAVAAAGLTCTDSNAQSAFNLNGVRTLYVGSLGTRDGAEDLRRKLKDALKHSHRFQLLDRLPADAVLEGQAEVWIRGYHSLSPRARKNSAYSEPVYGAYLSASVKGHRQEILWSYFATPPRASLGDVKADLAEQLIEKLTDAAAAAARENTPVTGSGGVSNTDVTLAGAGATFPYPLYQQWFSAFHSDNPAVRFTYDPVGSAAGVKRLVDGQLDFAGSDVPMTDMHDLAPASSTFVEIPTVVGAVVVIFNLPSFDGDLRLSSTVLAAILAGKITRWNDPALRALNRGSSLPSQAIQVVHRLDGSGTTYLLTNYLSKTNEDWKRTIGSGLTVKWPAGVGAVGNDGVSALVQQTPNSIGYTEFIYAFRRRLSFASIQNAAGHFIGADLPSIMAAAARAPTNATTNLAEADADVLDKNAYPITAFTWFLSHSQYGFGTSKGRVMRDFLNWMLTSGQKQCMGLGYAPLPRVIVDRELQVVSNLK